MLFIDTEIVEMKLLNEEDEDVVSVWATKQENKMALGSASKI